MVMITWKLSFFLILQIEFHFLRQGYREKLLRGTFLECAYQIEAPVGWMGLVGFNLTCKLRRSRVCFFFCNINKSLTKPCFPYSMCMEMRNPKSCLA